MNEDRNIRITKIIVLIIFIGLPLLVMFYNVAFGGFLLVSGLYSTHRAFRYIGSRHLQYDERTQLHNTNAAGKTILVQTVDDFGRELPASEVERRLAQARTKAEPKDTIVPVKFKITRK